MAVRRLFDAAGILRHRSSGIPGHRALSGRGPEGPPPVRLIKRSFHERKPFPSPAGSGRNPGRCSSVYLGRFVQYPGPTNTRSIWQSPSTPLPRRRPLRPPAASLPIAMGRVLVSNRSVYNLSFDSSLLKTGQDQNEAILRLLELCQDQGRTWSDSLPISVICRKPDTVYCFCSSNRKEIYPPCGIGSIVSVQQDGVLEVSPSNRFSIPFGFRLVSHGAGLNVNTGAW